MKGPLEHDEQSLPVDYKPMVLMSQSMPGLFPPEPYFKKKKALTRKCLMQEWAKNRLLFVSKQKQNKKKINQNYIKDLSGTQDYSP